MINITQGIYGTNFYERNGYFHKETQVYLSLPVRFRTLLSKKMAKFSIKYGIKEIFFTLGHDFERGIKAIAICYSKFDDFSEKMGESIVIGRIKRMRGDIRIPYNQDERILDKESNPTDIIKYPWIYKLEK